MISRSEVIQHKVNPPRARRSIAQYEGENTIVMSRSEVIQHKVNPPRARRPIA